MGLISVLKSLRHANIVSIEKRSEALTSAFLYIVMEYYLGAMCVRHCGFVGCSSEAKINITYRRIRLNFIE
jgi:serine/threonine protein kinase